jgi:hypothetical protein
MFTCTLNQQLAPTNQEYNHVLQLNSKDLSRCQSIEILFFL